MTVFTFLLGPPLASAAVAFLLTPYRRVVGWTNVALALVTLAAAVSLWMRLLAGEVVTSGPREFLRADALSLLVALAVAAVGVLTAWFGPGLHGGDDYDPAQARKYRIVSNLLTAMMLLAVTANNLGVMWIAIEATTISSALLIPLQVTKASVEASWKYILIGSVGIALAFGGTVLGYFDFVNLVGRQEDALNWTVLVASAPRLHPEVIQLAFVFILVGYGTKAGLAPMHTWRPDAYSEAPAALAATMSGVVLAVAIYAIVRWEAVVNAAVGESFTNELFVALGVLSLAIGSFSLVIQRNFKRMLAYSSIEHVGLMSVGLALGPLGTFAAMLHLLNHALAKSMTFLLAGRVLRRYGTAEISQVSGLLRTMPWTGGLFAAGVLAIIGLPPFGLFMSEFAILRAGFSAGRPWLMGIVLALLLVSFISMIGHLNRMLYGPPTEGVAAGEPRPWTLAPLALSVVALVVLGLTLPPSVDSLLKQIMEIGTP
ncbi:MAG TPA: proton-conducting transporter membrane subunit [Vicinamibacterales bacterium]|nr:proton-conducting transporter membrane subunit [Vicinamibacterales bacterium]